MEGSVELLLALALARLTHLRELLRNRTRLAIHESAQIAFGHGGGKRVELPREIGVDLPKIRDGVLLGLGKRFTLRKLL